MDSNFESFLEENLINFDMDMNFEYEDRVKIIGFPKEDIHAGMTGKIVGELDHAYFVWLDEVKDNGMPVRLIIKYALERIEDHE